MYDEMARDGVDSTAATRRTSVKRQRLSPTDRQSLASAAAAVRPSDDETISTRSARPPGGHSVQDTELVRKGAWPAPQDVGGAGAAIDGREGP